jgi:hypothetical protein
MTEELKSKQDRFIEDFQQKVSYYKYAKQNYLDSFQKDPLAKLLVQKFRFSPVKSGLVGLGIVLLTYIIGYIQFFWTGQEVAGITEAGFDFIYDLFLVPLVYGYYIWVSTRPPYIFLKLQEDGISFSNKEEYDGFVTFHVNNRINIKYIYISSFITSFGLACSTILLTASGTTVWGAPGANFMVLCFLKVPITWAIPWYMVCVIFLKETMTVWTFRKLLKSGKLNIDMFHKDKCGGLKPISDYLLTFVYLIVVCGFGLGYLISRSIKFGYFNQDIFIRLTSLVYLGLTYFYFYFPLHPVHKAMKKLELEIRAKMNWEGFLPLRAFTTSTFLKYVSSVIAPPLFLAILNYL